MALKKNAKVPGIKTNEVIRLSAYDKNGKKLAELTPDKKLSVKKIKAISILFYNEKGQRITRFLTKQEN